MERKFIVEGMMCSNCSKAVEKTVKKIKGVSQVSVNLLNKTLTLTAPSQELDSEIIKVIKNAGYVAEVATSNEPLTKKDNSALKRLIPSIILSIVITYLSMGEMFGLPYPDFLKSPLNGYILVGVLTLLTFIVIIINKAFFIRGYKAVTSLSPNMDTLVSAGALISFLYGVFTLVMVIIGTINKNVVFIEKYLSHLYFEAAAMILTIVQIGKLLEEKAKSKTGNAVKSLKNLVPNTATILVDGKEEKVNAKTVNVGDIIVVKQGESVPLDGVIVSGSGEFNESSITGESLPKFKSENNTVIASTILVNGYVTVEVTNTSENTILSKIIDYVERAEGSKPPIQTLADKISGIFVPVIFGISLVTFIVWLIISKDFSTALQFAVSVTVVSCPCALGLATPVAVTVSIGRNAKRGILIKNAEVLEQTGSIKTIVFDKTGTVTSGSITVDSEYQITEDLKPVIKSIEEKSSHPLAKSVVKYFSNYKSVEVEDFTSVIGKGVSGKIDDNLYKIGNLDFVKDCDNLLDFSKNLPSKTILFVSKNSKILGYLTVQDEIRQSAPETFEILKQMGIKTAIISGDNNSATSSVAKTLNADTFIGECLPEDKAKHINAYKQNGITAFVGDGINDSPALSVANVGFSLSSGTDIAIGASSVVLLKNDLNLVVETIKASKKTMRIIKQNLFWAFIYNALMIPIAAGVFYPLIIFNPIYSSIAMSLSSIFVVTNALRLNR